MQQEKSLLQIGDVASLSGTTVRTVRYYLEEGFIQSAERSQGGFYLFDRDVPERVKFIQQLKEMGIPLKEIKEMYRIRLESETGNDAYPKVREKLLEKRETVARKIKAYSRLLQELDEAVRVVSECEGCSQRPTRKNCMACSVIREQESIPVPVRAIL